jgi:hypothetical protein
MEIQNYPNYLIYDDGRVYNKKYNRLVKPVNYRYQRVNLYNSEGMRPFSIHRLVASHYIPNPDNLPTVDHIDRDKYNNHISNLRWATMKTQCENRSQAQMFCNNTTGHKNIYFDKSRNKWRFGYKNHHKRFNSKTDALCYKYIYFLKLRVSL